MFRITNNMLYSNNLLSIFQNNQGMLKAQEELGTGKRINRPSDDPNGNSQLLKLKTDSLNNKQYIKNIDNGLSWLNTIDASLNDMGNLLTRAKELALSQANASATAQTRSNTASEIENMIFEAIRLGNSSKGGQYVFSGKNNTVQPFTSGAVYYGSQSETNIEIFDNNTIGIGIDGSRFMAADLNPTITTSTLLSSLNRGGGISAGSIRINDRAGNSSAIDLSGATTIGDVLTTISNNATVNVTASINSEGNGITIVDDNSTPLSNLTISEVSGGSTALNLGILADRPLSTQNGLDLDASITSSTSIAQLKKGSGLTLTSFNITNGSASGSVTFSSPSTVGDIITQINNASSSQGLNITASINSSGTAIQITSTNTSTVPIVNEVANGTSASDLGISGGGNIINTLTNFKNALQKNDARGIAASIESVNNSFVRLMSVRTDVGSRINRLESTKGSLDKANEEILISQTKLEDADMVKAATDLAKFQTAYQATLKSTAMIIQPSLLDFIR